MKASLPLISATDLRPLTSGLLVVEDDFALHYHVGEAALGYPGVLVEVVLVAVVCDDARVELVCELYDEVVGVRPGGDLPDLLRAYQRLQLRLVVYVVLEARVHDDD